MDRNWHKFVALGALALALTACGSGEQGEDSSFALDESDPAQAQLTAPGLTERTALISDFQQEYSAQCPFYKEDGSPAEDGDIAGAELVLLSCRLSPIENFGIAMLKADGVSASEGTAFFTIGPNPDPAAFSPLWSLIGDMAGMTDLEEQLLRREMPGRLRFVGNLYSVDYDPIMTTDSGVRISFAGNKLQQGMGALRVDPPR